MSKRRSPGGGSITLRPGNKALIRVTMADGSRRGRTVSVQGATDDERREDAQRQLDALIGVLAEEGQLGIGGVTLRGWAGVWLERMEREQPRSAGTYDVVIRNQILTWELADDLLANIQPRDVRAWVRDLASGYERATTNKALAVLRMILEAAAEDGHVETNPAVGIKVPKDRTGRRRIVRRPLSKDELITVLHSGLPISDRALIAVAAVGGLRSGEVHAMPLSCVIRRDGMLCLRVTFGGYDGRPTKGGNERVVPVLSPALGLLEAWLRRVPPKGARNREGLLFPRADGGRRQLSNASPWLRRRLRRCGINEAHRFHDLRHTAGEALQNGWFGPAFAPEHVQAILGHSSVRQTEAYTGGAADAMLAAAKVFAGTDQRRITGSPELPRSCFPKGGLLIPREGSRNSFNASEFPGTYAESDPIRILRGSTEALIAACSNGTATVEQVMDWRTQVLDAEPDVFRRARELEADPYLFRRALEIARDLMPMIGAASSDDEEGVS